MVTLNGTVKTEAGKTRAVAIAKATDGVKSVHDSLKVVAKSHVPDSRAPRGGNFAAPEWVTGCPGTIQRYPRGLRPEAVRAHL